MTKVELTNLIKSQSHNLGFNLVGFSNPKKINNSILESWLNNGNDATMDWIKKRKNQRKNIFKYFPQAKTIISFGYNYYTGEHDLNSKQLKISNYAWGKDYHKTLEKRLKIVSKLLKTHRPNQFQAM